MKHRHLVVVVLWLAGLSAAAAEPVQYQLKEDTKLFGFLPGYAGNNAEYVIPFDKSYHLLTSDQRRVLREAYVEMGPADEPPFPVGGLKAIYETITEGQQRLLVSGTFRADVEIDTEGNPIALAVYRSPNRTVTKLVSSVVLLTKFKPAVCGGSPCKMGFPIRITFTTR